ncbi:carboxylating nicotinate-nucleotide diphosphorylase [Fredinandcohnia quinoae]|uniref:Probable nicotinate-nucleotide pyrophosphorylase [carboxylating] n=1 Tax=Fredinandcohnia quinoae TaxID=2918902 RepID=A0AAW5E6Q5_9BACI|nr:carboxylating nicotinate-nucleotide diphosphorylase [Fredinandcohnia sp. SECRCQ15]MCH1625707.1 carboxylating nicotinate-nucleotide diphosphorylase [Fredinandcohnia sp. SECRCQ15]
MNDVKLSKLLRQFFIEDIGERDITSESIFPAEIRGKAEFVTKEDGIIAGIDMIRAAYAILDLTIEVTVRKKDGEATNKGEIIATVEGPMAILLTGERVILNLLQRMSGIATATNQAVLALNSTHTRICDTRKTSPGLRMFEKYAVTCGGGFNHRIGLYDGVMIKDNHIAFCGSITKAVTKVREKIGQMVKIEVETETREQVVEAVDAGADIIMFDNRTPAEIKDFITLVPKHIVTEASGGITMNDLHEYGDTGVDYISLGFLTHSVKALDISLRV